MNLSELRLEIDMIDDQLVQLFAQRMDVSARIADYKKAHDLPIYVPTREAEKLRDVAHKAGPDMQVYTKVLYDLLFELSRGYQSKRNAPRTALFARISDAISSTDRLPPRDATIACMGDQPQMEAVCRKMLGQNALMFFRNVDGILSAVSQGMCSRDFLLFAAFNWRDRPDISVSVKSWRSIPVPTVPASVWPCLIAPGHCIKYWQDFIRWASM